MKKLACIFLLLTGTGWVRAQLSEKKADALISPRLAQQEITVGGPDADVCGFNNRSIQYAIDAVSKTGGTIKLNPGLFEDRKSTRLNSSHVRISYAVFCLKK